MKASNKIVLNNLMLHAPEPGESGIMQSADAYSTLKIAKTV